MLFVKNQFINTNKSVKTINKFSYKNRLRIEMMKKS